jgi:hypothetical protein
MEMGAMDASHALLPLGLVARSINGTNELWLAAALSLPGLDELSPPQFASYLGALVSNEMVKKNIMVWSAYQVGGKGGGGKEGVGGRGWWGEGVEGGCEGGRQGSRRR